MRNVTLKSCRENQNTQYMFNNFFWKSCCLWDNVGKYFRANRPHMTIWCTRIACWKPKATLAPRICNIYCLSTAAVIERARLNVTLCVQCPSCSSIKVSSLSALSCWNNPINEICTVWPSYKTTVCINFCFNANLTLLRHDDQVSTRVRKCRKRHCPHPERVVTVKAVMWYERQSSPTA
jgi:hypothetical protein